MRVGVLPDCNRVVSLSGSTFHERKTIRVIVSDADPIRLTAKRLPLRSSGLAIFLRTTNTCSIRLMVTLTIFTSATPATARLTMPGTSDSEPAILPAAMAWIKTVPLLK